MFYFIYFNQFKFKLSHVATILDNTDLYSVNWMSSINLSRQLNTLESLSSWSSELSRGNRFINN